jgi:cell division protein FtsL
MVGFLVAMSVSIEAVRVERNLAAMNDQIAKGRSREKILEESLIDLTKESRLRAYAKANHLTRALPAEVLYLP